MLYEMMMEIWGTPTNRQTANRNLLIADAHELSQTMTVRNTTDNGACPDMWTMTRLSWILKYGSDTSGQIRIHSFLIRISKIHSLVGQSNLKPRITQINHLDLDTQTRLSRDTKESRFRLQPAIPGNITAPSKPLSFEPQQLHAWGLHRPSHSFSCWSNDQMIKWSNNQTVSKQ